MICRVMISWKTICRKTIWRAKTLRILAAVVSLAFVFVTAPRSFTQRANDTAESASPEQFVDVTQRLGINFQYQSSHTSRKYLLETMGPGVALFDYDNDGRLDIFLVNGAPLSDPTPKGTIPRKTGSQYWNRLYHQKADGTFEDVTDKAGLQGVGYGDRKSVV